MSTRGPSRIGIGSLRQSGHIILPARCSSFPRHPSALDTQTGKGDRQSPRLHDGRLAKWTRAFHSHFGRSASASPSSSPRPSRTTEQSSMQAGGSPQPPAFLTASQSEILAGFKVLEDHQIQRYIASSSAINGGGPRWARVKGAENVERNRYANISPWDVNRVKLSVPEGVCDYINASHIALIHRPNGSTSRYIATQGPKETSRGHFWHMMWNETQDTGVIVMLTQTHESGKEKCFAYFPQTMENRVLVINQPASAQSHGVATSVANEHFQGVVELMSVEYDHQTRSTIRKLVMTVGSKTKTVYHYLFSGWPDFGIPQDDDREALVRLIRTTAQKAGAPENPRVVHCSAGVGRSGTFIALDYFLKELETRALDAVKDDEDPIFDTVNQLREQRMMMVQGDVQLLFLYEIVRDLWHEQHGLQPPLDRHVDPSDTSS